MVKEANFKILGSFESTYIILVLLKDKLNSEGAITKSPNKFSLVFVIGLKGRPVIKFGAKRIPGPDGNAHQWTRPESVERLNDLHLHHREENLHTSLKKTPLQSSRADPSIYISSAETTRTLRRSKQVNKTKLEVTEIHHASSSPGFQQFVIYHFEGKGCQDGQHRRCFK